jgi:hypothetical protein
MNPAEIQEIALGALHGLASSTVFILALFIGFCVLVGLTKLKTTRGDARVVKSLDETVTHQAFQYLPPEAPRGPADQLRAPELVEATQRSPAASANPGS